MNSAGKAFSLFRSLLEPLTQLFGDDNMASNAEGPDILQTAFTTALDDWNDMIGSPGAQLWAEPGKFLPKHVERSIAFWVSLNNLRKPVGLQPGLAHQSSKDPL